MFHSGSNLKSWFLDQWKTERKKLVCNLGQVIFLVLGLSLLMIGNMQKAFPVMLCGGLAIQIMGMFYCFEDIQHRFIFLIFQITIFFFLQNRPILDMMEGKSPWQDYTVEGNIFALTCVPVSILSMQVGARLLEWFRRKTKVSNPASASLCPKRQTPAAFRLAALLIFLFCNVFFLLVQKEQLDFVSQNSYDEYYLNYSAQLPWFIYALSAIAPYALCIYLATLPKKRDTYIIFAIFLFSTLVELMIGSRTPIVLNSIFIFVYICFRDIMGDSKKWLGKTELITIAICMIPCLVGLAAVVALRNHKSVTTDHGIWYLISALLYGLSYTYKTLCVGYAALPLLPGGKKCYTLGVLIDYFFQGRLGQFLFHAPAFPAGNSVEHAVNGNSLAHSLSYVVRDDYLQGGGTGSCYILENYADLGWVGVILFSICLGALLIGLVYLFRKNWFTRTITLAILLQIFITPRAESTGFLIFLIGAQFWCAILGSVVGGAVFTWIQKRFSKSRKSSVQPPDISCS